MKHSVMFFLAIVATLSSFISCQKEIETPKDDITSSHTVSFVADAPKTKTNATVDGNKVNYSWAKGDEDKFNVYEIVNGRHTPASTVMAILKDGLMEISATFGGEKISDASYQAVFNTGVKTAQTNNDETDYDQDSDVLVSEVVSDPNNDFDNGIALKFKRLVAVNKATLKNLEKGAYVAHTIIETTDGKDLAGKYSNITDSFGNCESKISVETLHGITGGTAPVNFITLPVADTKLKVTAVTIDDNEKFVAAYEKTFSKGISLTQGNLTSFGVLMSEKTGETIDFSKDETTTATTDELTWDRTLVHVMVLKGESTTDANNYYPGVSNYSSTRFYKNSTLAITPRNSLSISKIVFTATSDKYANALANSTWTNATASASGTTVSIIPTDGTKEVSAVISATTGHKSIEIIYGQPKIKEKHSVIISSDVKNGTITATPTTAYAGENITLTATPDGGYILSEWNVTTATGNVTVTDNAFVMPDEDVTVSAVFTKKGEVNDGSLEHPYTAAEAIAAIKANTGSTGKYVKGIVKADPSFNATYSSLSYDIVSGEATLYIYSGQDLGNAGFVGAEDLKAGDEVVVLGTLKKYTDKAGVVKYELDKKNYLISINGETQIYRGLAVSGQKTAFTVGDAFEFGGKALQVWRGKADVDVTASATFSGYNMSTEGKQTVTVTVGEESVTYEINVRAAGGEAPKTYTLQFGKNYNSASIQNYTSTWSVTCDEFTWGMVNWNNNQNGWTNVRAGRKDKASVATITTKTTMPEAISTITMTIDAINATYVNSIKLEVLSADEKTVKETITGEKVKGNCVFNITNPQKDCKYKITVDCKGMSGNNAKNGFVQVSKVVYTNN